MAEVRFCTVRFNLSKPEHQKAWQHLQNMNRDKYKSYSNAVISALNKYFDTDYDENSDSRIINQILQAIKTGKIEEASMNNDLKEVEEGVEWDFLGKR